MYKRVFVRVCQALMLLDFLADFYNCWRWSQLRIVGEKEWAGGVLYFREWEIEFLLILFYFIFFVVLICFRYNSRYCFFFYCLRTYAYWKTLRCQCIPKNKGLRVHLTLITLYYYKFFYSFCLSLGFSTVLSLNVLIY